MRRRSLLLFAVALPLIGCAPSAPQKSAAAAVDTAAVKDAIQAREKEWSAAYLAGNAAGVAALYTTDAASIQPTGDWARGRDGIAKTNQAQFDTVAITSREDITEEVIPLGDYIVEVGHYAYQGTHKTSKKPMSGAGRYMVLWRKDADGVWRLHRDIGNDAPAKPAASAATAPTKKS
jgi:uncharacterized protein (TIGR02246 family)